MRMLRGAGLVGRGFKPRLPQTGPRPALREQVSIFSPVGRGPVPRQRPDAREPGGGQAPALRSRGRSDRRGFKPRLRQMGPRPALRVQVSIFSTVGRGPVPRQRPDAREPGGGQAPALRSRGSSGRARFQTAPTADVPPS